MLKCVDDLAGSRCQTVYVVALFAVVNAVNQLHRYLLIAAIVPMSNELEFGNRECRVNNATVVDEYIASHNLPINASEFCEEDEGFRCENGTSYNNVTLCKWYYNGNGIEYQILAGPAFIIILGICGIPVTILAEMGHVNRRNVVGICIMMWSATIILTGFAQSLAEIYIWRFLLGFFQAAFNPFSMSMLASMVSTAKRGAAIGIASSGQVFGFALAFAFISVVDAIGWRWTYISAGIGGAVLGFVMLFTVANLKHQREIEGKWDNLVSVWDIPKFLSKEPWCVLMLIFLAFSSKMGYQYTTSYNLNQFMAEYYPEFPTEKYLSWILAITGLLAYSFGGIVSDIFGKRFGVNGRLSMIVVMELIQIPLMVMFILFDLPVNLICGGIGMVIGDGWIGIGLAAIADIVKPSIRTIVYALFFCCIDVVGGSIQVIFAPVADATDLRTALLWVDVAALTTATLLIVASLGALVCYQRKRRSIGEAEEQYLRESKVYDETSRLNSNSESKSYTEL